MKAAVALIAALALAAPAAAANTLTRIDMTGYPEVRATLVTAGPTSSAPRVTENGRPVAGLEAQNLGRAKSVVLAVDRSRSMTGGTLAQAGAAARSFVAAKPGADRVAVVTFGSRAVQATGFSTGRFEASAALRSLAVDRVQGTALYDAVELASQALGADTPVPVFSSCSPTAMTSPAKRH